MPTHLAIPNLRVTKYMDPAMPGLTPKQRDFLTLDGVNDILYGGAAGGGKSIALLLAALQYVDIPAYSAILMRRTFADLSLPGALMDRARAWLTGSDARFEGQSHVWRFPSTATLTFGYLDTEADKYRYQGPEFQFIGIDESTQLSETQIRYMFSRLRKSSALPPAMPLRFRLASNPGGVSHQWHKIRYLDNRTYDRLYLPARLEDNPHVDYDSYVRSLDQLDPITRRQLLEGDWTARTEGSFFRREWFKIVDQVPNITIRSRVRGWDLAASKDGKRTAGVKVCRDDSGVYYVEHVVKGKWTPGSRDEVILRTAQADGRGCITAIEQEPGSGGIAQIATLVKLLVGYPVRGAQITGDKATRAGPVASQAEHGNILLVNGPWVLDFLDELDAFPEGEYKDQVDALSIAFAQATVLGVPRAVTSSTADTRAYLDEDDAEDAEARGYGRSGLRARDVANHAYPHSAPFRR
jgi:predicted phage terminase large subunit-like protein